VLPDLLHGKETRVWDDQAYHGQRESLSGLLREFSGLGLTGSRELLDYPDDNDGPRLRHDLRCVRSIPHPDRLLDLSDDGNLAEAGNSAN